MTLTSVKFEELLDFIIQLPLEQKQLIRQRLNEDWGGRFGKAMAEIHAQMPVVSEAELVADIEQAINEVRQRRNK